MATYGTQGRSQREKSLTLLRALAAPAASSYSRLKRSTDGECDPSLWLVQGFWGGRVPPGLLGIWVPPERGTGPGRKLWDSHKVTGEVGETSLWHTGAFALTGSKSVAAAAGRSWGGGRKLLGKSSTRGGCCEMEGCCKTRGCSCWGPGDGRRIRGVTWQTA